MKMVGPNGNVGVYFYMISLHTGRARFKPLPKVKLLYGLTRAG